MTAHLQGSICCVIGTKTNVKYGMKGFTNIITNSSDTHLVHFSFIIQPNLFLYHKNLKLGN